MKKILYYLNIFLTACIHGIAGGVVGYTFCRLIEKNLQ